MNRIRFSSDLLDRVETGHALSLSRERIFMLIAGSDRSGARTDLLT
jgi:hypothetical protein